MKSKKITKTLAASALTLTTLLGVGATAVYAQDGGTKSSNSTRAKPSDAQRLSGLTAKLDDGVKAGTITEAQKTKILEFFKASKPTMNKDATKEEREAERSSREAAITKFATDNNISLDFLKTLHGGPKGGPGEGRGTPPTPAERLEHLTARLDAAVKAGTITEAQKQLVLDYEAAHPFTPKENLTEAQRDAERTVRKTEFEAFAKANSIPSDLLKPEGRPLNK